MILQLLVQCVPCDFNIELIVTWIRLSQDWLYGLPDLVAVSVYHVLDYLQLVYYVHTSRMLQLSFSHWDYEAYKAGLIEY